MNILALDLGTTTGWALREMGSSTKGAIFSGSQSFAADRFEGGGMRYLKFRRWLSQAVGEDAAHRRPSDEPLMVVFEEVRRHIGTSAAHAYGGFLAHLTAWCEEREIPYQGVPVGTIKKFATGGGKGKKDAVILAVRALGHLPIDDNEADALALLHWAMKEWKGLIDEAPRNLDKRLAPDKQSRHRIQVGAVPVARKRIT